MTENVVWLPTAKSAGDERLQQQAVLEGHLARAMWDLAEAEEVARETAEPEMVKMAREWGVWRRKLEVFLKPNGMWL